MRSTDLKKTELLVSPFFVETLLQGGLVCAIHVIVQLYINNLSVISERNQP